MTDGFGLSPQQRRLWRLQGALGERPFRARALARIHGGLDPGLLREAVDRVAGRYEILRTTFPSLPGLTLPLQRIADDTAVAWLERDLSGAPEAERSAALEDFLRDLEEEPFDLARGPLLRLSVARLSVGEHALALVLPCLCADAVTLQNLLREIASSYASLAGAGADGADSDPLQYADLAEWQNELLEHEETAAGREHWEAWDPAACRALRLPFEQPPAGGDRFEPVSLALPLDRGLAERSAALSASLGTSVSTLFLAVWQSLLWRLTEQTEIALGLAAECRSYEGLSESLGPLASFVPLSTRLDGGLRFAEAVARVGDAVREAAEWQEYFRWESVADRCGLTLEEASFPVSFAAQEHPEPWRAGPLAWELLRCEAGIDRSLLELRVHQNGGPPSVALSWNAAAVSREDAEGVARAWRALLGSAVLRPEARLGELALAAPEKRRQLAQAGIGADPAAPVPVHELFEREARRVPGRTAVRCGGETSSYAELEERSGWLARLLRRHGVGADAVVAVCLERSLAMPLAVMGVLRAGGAYLPLEPELPLERKSFLLADARPRAILTERRFLAGLPEVRIPVLALDGPWEDGLPDAGGEPLLPGADPRSLAYVIYTSGSTGVPKGVGVEHRQLSNYVQGTLERLDLRDGAGYAMVSTIAADLGHTALFPSLCSGGTLHLVREELTSDPIALAAALERDPVDCLKITPSHLAALLAGAPSPWLLPRACLVVGGEASRREWVESLLALRPGLRVINEYGPTETTVGTLTYVAEPGLRLATLPLGESLAGTVTWLLGPDLEPLPAWFSGELYLGGASVSRGYLGRPDLTADRFVPDPLAGTPGARMYRTGDLARRLSDGTLEFLGRADDQVKVRGFRIEPGEIETVLEGHPEVRRAAVAAHDDGSGSRRLVAYVVAGSGSEVGLAGLREHLAQRLPDFMVPSAFVFLDSLPLNTNGKVDRRALPEPDWRHLGESRDFVAPETPAETTLADIWAEVLGVDRVGALDNFFLLGGDSIRSLVVRARAEARGVLFTVQQLFDHPVLRDLAREVAAGDVAAAAPQRTEPFGLLAEADRARLPEGLEDAYPLARLQAGMLFHSDLAPGTGIYHDLHSVRLGGRCRPDLLSAALEHVLRRHPVLRTGFDLASYSEPLQLVWRHVPVPFSTEDLSGLPPERQLETVNAWLNAERNHGFDGSRPPLVRFHVQRLGAEVFQFTLSFHHSVLDGWSAASLLTELFQLYTALLQGEPVPEAVPPSATFRDFIELERRLLASSEAREFWARQLEGSTLDSLPRRRTPDGEARAQALVLPIPEEVDEGLQTLARASAVPLKSVLLAAHFRVLALLTGRDDVVTGVFAHGRPESEGGDRVLGLFLNTLPLRLRLSGGTWNDLVRAVFDLERAAFPFRSFPLAEMQRLRGRQQLFETACNFLHYHVYQGVQEIAGLEVLDRSGYEETNFALEAQFSIQPFTGRLLLSLDYLTSRLDHEQAEAIGGYYLRTLAAMASRPGEAWDGAGLFSEAERRQLLVDWGRGGASAGPLSGFDELFAGQVRRTPEAVAVALGNQRLTYAGLDRRAGRLAQALELAGAGPEDVVPLLAERGPDFLTAVIALFRAGGAYLPLDPLHPLQRTLQIVAASGARRVLAARALAPALARALDGRAGAPELLILEDLLEAPERPGSSAPARRAHPSHLAYVIYTSGSTGVPKGAMLEQRGMVNHLWAKVAELGLDAADRVAQTASQCFDISVWQLLAPLLVGGRVQIVPDEVAHDAVELLREVERQGITVLETVPSLLRLLLAELGRDGGEARPAFRRLRWLIPTGEALPPDLCRDWLRLYPAVPLLNAYGPTECSDDVAHHRIPVPPEPEETRIPIGRPVPGLALYIADSRLQPLPAGVAGELLVGGAGVGRGYLGDGGRTAASWCPDPFSGEPGARLYRTGDLARFHPAGAVEYLGRIDHQVKVRGHRIELGEVEAALTSLPDVRAAVAAVREDAPGDPRLVAWVVGDATAEELRRSLRERLPDAMVPAVFVRLAELPLTPNGKVDRKALPAPDRSAGEEAWRAPRTPVEEVLSGIWAELLDLDRVGSADDFFDLGGHSLLATRVMSRLRAVFAVEMPLRDLFEAPTLEGLAARVEAALRDNAGLRTPPLAPLAPELREGPLPLSFAQQRLWFIDQLKPGSPLYNIPVALRVEGPLDPAVLARCLGEIVRRHEALRTVFAKADGWPVQVIQAAAPFTLPLVDLGGLPERERETKAAGLTGEEADRPFDLARDPLLRGVLLRLAQDDHVVALTMHHIASDGWSMGILVREITTLYAELAGGGASTLPELPVQYADFAVWQRSWLEGEILESEVSFWRQQLAGLPPRLELPTDRPRPAVQSFRGASRPARLPAELARQAQALSRREGATLFLVLLAGFQALLAQYSRQRDLAVGTPVAGRNQVETEGLIGFFVNTLVLRGDLAGGPTFRELLGRARESALAAHLHQSVPFERLVQELSPERSLAQTPLFQVMFVLQNNTVESMEVQGLRLRPVGAAGTTSKFDLTLGLQEWDGGLAGAVEHSTDLFDAATIDRLIAHYERLLTAALAEPELAALELPLLTGAERHQLLAEWNDTVRTRARGPLLHGLVEAQAARTPDAPAVTCEGETLTYGQLDARAERLARHLRGLGCGPESRVCVALERSLDLVVTLLGVLKAGAAYVPLDPEYPRERLTFMLEDSRPAALLIQESLRNRLPLLAGLPVVEPAALPEETGEAAPGTPEDLGDGHLAYVIYTSGSTGRPKGAMVHHRGICNRLLWMQEAYGLTPADTILQKTPFSFDVSVWELFWPLATGARLVLARPGGHRDSAYLVDLIRRERVTTLHFVPSLLEAFLEEPSLGGGAPSLRRVVASGEALSAELEHRFFQRFPGGPFLENLYGPTEASVDVTFWPCSAAPGRRAVPIGRPVSNTRIHVLDPGLQPVPAGVPGELWIGGMNVGRGYLGRPDLTAERFLPDPRAAAPGDRIYRTGDLARHRPDGAIEYLGRLDHQVKVRGFRIELGEIEAALAALDGVREAVVAARDDAPGPRRLVAYLVAEGGPAQDAAGVRERLRERLPEHMIPAAFVVLDALPLNANGKVDRRALPRPDWRSLEAPKELVAPETVREQVLADVWAEVLGVERVGVYDNFFHLGGDSIRSIVVSSRAELRGVAFSIEQLFGHPVLRDLARVAGERQASAPGPEGIGPFALLSEADRARLPEDVEDAYPLASLQGGMLYHSELDPESAVYHDVFSFRLSGRFDEGALAATIAQVARRHPALRTSFAMAGFSEPLQLVHRQVEVPFATDDLRHLGAEEGRRIALAWVDREAFTPFDGSRAPLARFRVHRFGDGTFQVSLSFHHAILDGWSVATLVAELFRRYLALLDDPAAPEEAPPAATLREFVHLERSTIASAEAREFWRRHLEAAPLLRLPRRRKEPAAAERRGEHLGIPLPDGLAEGLRQAARSLSLPLKSVLMAVHFRVLGLVTGLTDVVGGVISSGRPERPDGEQALGLFLNTLPLRIALPGGSWSDLAHAAAEAERGALPFRRFPLSELQRMEGGRPLFETAFNFLHFHVYDGLSELPGLDVLSREGYEETDLTLVTHFELTGASQILLILSYQTAEHDREELEEMSRRYLAALEAMAAAPRAPYDAWGLFTEAERAQLAAWNRTAHPMRLPPLVHAIFERQVERSPEACAAEMEAGRLTYRELDRRAARLARRLRAAGVGPDDPVGMCLERSLAVPVAVLGILKAGGAYLPLDPAYPAERLSAMAEDARLRWLVCDKATLALLPAALRERSRIVLLGPAGEMAGAEGEEETPPLPVAPENLAYVLYTSGSTGRPKGVAMPHGPLANLIDWQVRATTAPGPLRTAQFSALSFDASFHEMLTTWSQGGTLVLLSEPVRRDFGSLLHLLAERSIQQLFLPFVALQQLAEEAVESGVLPTALREVITAGEQLQATAAVRELFRRLPGCRLVNAYGPTETHVVTAFTLPESPEAWPALPPIGRSIDNLQARVLDASLQPLPPGVPGEVCFGGAGLARGYLGRSDLTAERFLPDPQATEPGARVYRTGDLVRYLSDGGGPAGEIEFLGRNDHQVKVRGFRVEPGEIETVMALHPGVREAAVVVREVSDAGDRRLVGYFVPRSRSAAEAADALAGELRTFLAGRLPDYMVPWALVPLEAFPLTPSGKLDRRGLPAPAAPRRTEAGLALPRGPVEELLAGLWADVLGLERVGTADHFFELGGHSLLATRVMSRLRAAFGIQMPLRVLFEAPRLADLAARVEEALRAEAGRSAPPLVPVPRDEPLSLSFAQQRLWFIDRLEPGAPLYNIPVALRLRGDLDSRVLALCFTEIVRRHETLRTVFTVQESSAVQVIRPASPVELPTVDLSRLPEPRREAAALALIREQASLPFDLSDGPLLRVLLLRLGDGGHLSLLTLHHIVSDGWSMGILVRELRDLYPAFLEGRPSPLPELPLQYADFAAWQRRWLSGGALERLIEDWRWRLAGAPPRLDLPEARPRPEALSSRGAARHRLVPARLLEQLRALGHRESATLFMTLLAPLDALLHARTGASRIVVGTDVAGRDHPETEGMIGFFINQLPLCTDLSGDPTLRELLGRVRETALAALTHQDLPFDQLVDALEVPRSLDHTPVFQVKLMLQNTPRESLALPGLTLETVPLETETAQLDLHWTAAEVGEELWITLTYSTDLFEAPLIERLLDQYLAWLQAFVERPDARLGAVAAELARGEQAQRTERDQELKAAGLGKLRGIRRPVGEDRRAEDLKEVEA